MRDKIIKISILILSIVLLFSAGFVAYQVITNGFNKVQAVKVNNTKTTNDAKEIIDLDLGGSTK